MPASPLRSLWETEPGRPALASEHLYEFPDDLDVVGAILASRSEPASGR